MPLEMVWIGGVVIAGLMTLAVALIGDRPLHLSNLRLQTIRPTSPENINRRNAHRLG